MNLKQNEELRLDMSSDMKILIGEDHEPYGSAHSEHAFELLNIKSTIASGAICTPVSVFCLPSPRGGAAPLAPELF